MISVILCEVAIAMHCNLRLPDVAPDVLGFNYVTSPIMHMNQPTTSVIPYLRDADT